MNYQEIHAKGFISNFIKNFWEFQSTDACSYEILPDGFFDLIFEIQQGCIINSSLTGVWTKRIHVSIPKNTRLVGVRFKLIAAEYIFRRSIKELKNSEAKLPEFFLASESLHFQDFESFTKSITKKLDDHLKTIKEVDKRKLDLFSILYEREGEINIDELSNEIVWSSRQINRYFNNRFGLSLKTYCNILKCYSSLKHINQGKLFPERNYYDQAHFIKQVKQITGFTPTKLYLNKNDRFLQLATMNER